jgi:excisionase family DNA binding protein
VGHTLRRANDSSATDIAQAVTPRGRNRGYSIRSPKPRIIRRLIAERRIRFTKLGRHVRLDREDLDAFVAAGRVEPDGSTVR